MDKVTLSQDSLLDKAIAAIITEDLVLALKIAKTLSAYDVKVDILDTRGPNDIGDMSRDQFNKIYTPYNVNSKKTIGSGALNLQA